MSVDPTEGASPVESFVAPEGEYVHVPALFSPAQMPQIATAGTVPALPVKLSIVTVTYPAKRDGMPGLGSLLGMGGGGQANTGAQPAAPAKDALSLSPLLTANNGQPPSSFPSPNSPSAIHAYEASLSSSVSEDPPSSDAATQSPVPQTSDLSQSFASSRYVILSQITQLQGH